MNEECENKCKNYIKFKSVNIHRQCILKYLFFAFSRSNVSNVTINVAKDKKKLIKIHIFIHDDVIKR